MSADKPTAEERQASTQPGCKCTAHCEHVWGDQAPTADEREIDRLKRCLFQMQNAAIDLAKQLKDATDAAGYFPPSQTLAERIAELREDADLYEHHYCNPGGE